MQINEMILFYHVVKYKSFSQAAEQLGVSKSHISKHVTQLEKELKSQLLHRSTRQLSLTEAGEIFYQHCEKVVALAEQGYNALATYHKQPAGTLKISIPPALGLHLLSEPIIKFNQKYPEVKLNIALENEIVDLIQKGYDLALRSALLTDSNLIAQKLTILSNVLVASPRYLKQHGLVKNHEQLQNHVFAIYSGSKAARQMIFTRNKQTFEIVINSVIESNSLDLIQQMVSGDRCMAVLPKFMVIDLIAKKKLIHCLPHYQLPESPLYAIYPEKMFMPLKVKCFLDEIKNDLRDATKHG